MITEARRLLSNSSVESINVELFPQDTTSSYLTSRNGPIISFHQDSLDTLYSPPLKESLPMNNAEKDTSEEKLSDSSIDDLL